jgi:hypothetical protein
VSERYPDERVAREIGIDAPVVPLIELSSGQIDYWSSIHQSWREDTSHPTTRKIVYHTTSITVYWGSLGTVEKHQLFRAEWPGLRRQPDGNLTFEAPGAGHPHWQIDVYQNRVREIEKDRERLTELGRTLSELTPVEDFAEIVVEELSPRTDLSNALHLARLSRVHFASSTRWATQCWTGDPLRSESHATSPNSVEEIRNWVSSTIRYIQRELAR